MMRMSVVLPLPLGPTSAMREPVDTVRLTESRSCPLPEGDGDPREADERHGTGYGDWLKKITTGEMPGWVTMSPWRLSFASDVNRRPPAAAL